MTGTMMASPKNKAPGATGALQDSLDEPAHRVTGRPEFQGKANHRNRDQRPPRWQPAHGAKAFADLARLWGPPRRPRGRS